jgi:hypothetical protein
MPLSRYNKAFGGKPGSASKAHASMVGQYGPVKGERVFYATMNKRKGQKKKGSFKPTYRDAAMALKARSKSRDSESEYA